MTGQSHWLFQAGMSVAMIQLPKTRLARFANMTGANMATEISRSAGALAYVDERRCSADQSCRQNRA